MYSLKEEKISQLTSFSVFADNKRIRNKIIEGKSFQATRSGKNLLPIAIQQTITKNGITFTSNGDGSYYLTGTATADTDILFELPFEVQLPNSTLYCHIRNDAVVDVALLLYSDTVGSSPSLSEINRIMTSPNLTNLNLSKIGVHIISGQTVDVKFTPSIEFTSEYSEYEPYGAMPSPEFSSEIQSVGDDVNLFDGEYEIGLISGSNGQESYNADYIRNKNPIPVEPNTNYKFSTDSKLFSTFFVYEYKEDGTYNQTATKVINLKDYLTTNEGTKYIRFRPDYATTDMSIKFKVQKGTVATAYSEYGKGTVEIKQSGSNLIDLKDIKQQNYCTVEEVSNGIKVTPNSDTYNPSVYINCVLEAGSYYFYMNKTASTMNITFHDENNNKVSGSNIYNSGVINISARTSYMRINTAIVDGSYILPFENLYINKEKEDLGYKPYIQNNYIIPLSQPLRSLPNGVCDTIEEDGIHRRVRELRLAIADMNNSENYPGWSNVKEIQEDYPSINGWLSTVAKYYSNIAPSDNNISINTMSGNGVVFLDKSRFALTQTEWKEQYPDLVFQLQYELAEEVIEPFDDEQQAVINSMETFEGVNHFSLIGDLETTLTFDYNPQITEEIKKAFKYNITKAYLEVSATDKASGFQINEDNYLQSIDFDDCRYIEGEGVIGSCVAKELQGKFVNVDTSFDIENREIECFIGAETKDNITHYLRLGKFIVQKPENDNVKDNTSFDSLDYMIKFNKEYVHRMAKYFKTGDIEIIQDKQYYILNDSGVYEEVIVPHKEEISNYYELIDEYTLMQLLKDICNQAGVTLGTFNFRNADYVVHGNRFDSGVSCRDVLKAIAQAAFSWARINEYNELVLDFETSDTISEEIDYNEYYGLNFNDNYGPVNTVVLKNSQAEGENITIKNDKLINSAGGKNLLNIFDENWRLYNGIKQADGSIKANVNNTYYITLKNYSEYWKNYVIKNKGKTLTFSQKESIEGYGLSIVIYGTRITSEYNYQAVEGIGNKISITISDDFTDVDHIELRTLRKMPVITFTDTTTVISQLQLEEGPIATNYEEFIPLGPKELAISDNPFAYSEETRKAIIQAGEAIYGFKYVPLSVETIGTAYLNCKDKLKIKNMQDGDLETYVFDTRISYQGTLKSNVETLAMTDTETKYRYDGRLTTAQRRTEFRVDKAEQKITSLVKATTEQGEKLTEAVQDLDGFKRTITDKTDETAGKVTTIEEKVDGLITSKSVSGGQNLIKNSVGYFGNDYWQINSETEGTVLSENSTDVKQNSISGSALKLQAETIYQDIKEIKNGEYYLSFNYKKIISAAVATLKVNDLIINLTEQNWKEETRLINVTTNNIKIEMTTDLNSSILITDLMLTEGNLQVSWTQNNNESYTDTVQIGKGVRITATGSDTEFVAEATGITINNTESGTKVAEFTKYGTETQELVAHKDVKIADSLLIQKIGNQTWFSSL